MVKCLSCSNTATYGFEIKEYCKEHAADKMQLLKYKCCKIVNCRNKANIDSEKCDEHEPKDYVKKIYNIKLKEKKESKAYPYVRCKFVSKKLPNGCENKAKYAKSKFESPSRCVEHKKDDMIFVLGKMCEEKICTKQAAYGYKDGKIQFCYDHQLPQMIEIKSKRCIAEGCIDRANYGFPKQPLEYCKNHKKEGMKTKGKLCEHCLVRATFGYKKKEPMRCSQHKEKDMKDVVNRTCEFCDKIPNYGFKGNTATRCTKHKEKEMINLTHPTCQFKGCPTIPNYNLPGEKKGIYCVKHKSDDMILVSSKCEYVGCKKQPVFGFKDDKARFCSMHSKIGMEDLRTKKCKYCTTVAMWNFPDNKPEYCAEHALVGMIDIKRKFCVAETPFGCKKRKEYGYLFQQKTHCKEHHLKGMYEQNRPTCKDCSKNAYYAKKETDYPIRCEEHAKKGYVNVVEKKCRSCRLEYILNENNLCEYCVKEPKQNNNITNISRNKKELSVKKMFDKYNLKYEFHDKIIDTQCNYKRPDFVFDYLFFKIIVEVDEYQHSKYDKKDEKRRMKMIHQSFGGTPVIFIRYNPDEFQGVKVSKRDREEKLRELLRSFQNVKEWNIPLSYINLYYDGKIESKLKKIKY